MRRLFFPVLTKATWFWRGGCAARKPGCLSLGEAAPFLMPCSFPPAWRIGLLAQRGKRVVLQRFAWLCDPNFTGTNFFFSCTQVAFSVVLLRGIKQLPLQNPAAAPGACSESADSSDAAKWQNGPGKQTRCRWLKLKCSHLAEPVLAFQITDEA